MQTHTTLVFSVSSSQGLNVQIIVSAILRRKGVGGVAFRDMDSMHRSVSMAPFRKLKGKLPLRPWMATSHLPATPFTPLEHPLCICSQTVSLKNILQGRCRHAVRLRKQQATEFSGPCFFCEKKKKLCQKLC